MISNISLSEWAEYFIILPSGRHIRCEPHQKLIHDHCFSFGADGRLPYQTVIYSAPKKSGTTTENALVSTYWLFNIQAPDEIVMVANKRDQVISRAFKELRGFIQRNPVLRAEVLSMRENQITLKNGSTVLAIPNDFAGEAGSNHGLSTWDELWGFTTERDRRLYEELTPVPTRKNSIRLVTTYAGFEGESGLLEDLYREIFQEDGTIKAGVERPLDDGLPCYAKGELFVYWDHEPRMPWQTPQYYESQRRQLRLNTYLRLHENRWVSSETTLFDMEKWDACIDANHKPPLPNKRVHLWVGVDASTKRDRSAVVSVYREGDKLMLGPKRFWQPSRSNPMDLEATIERFLLELYAGYSLICVRYDPFQFHRSATTLKRAGLRMEEFPQTTGNLTEMGQDLYDLIEYGNIVLYPCPHLRQEAMSAIGKETGRGLRIVKEKASQKIDQIVALAMAALAGVKRHQARAGVWGSGYARSDDASGVPLSQVANASVLIRPKEEERRRRRRKGIFDDAVRGSVKVLGRK